MTSDLYYKMKKSGCEYLSFGIESASNRVFRSMKKLFDVSTIKKNIADCHNAGIAVCTNWIIGYFMEKDDDFEQTIQFITDNIRYINELDASLFAVKPHTYVYENRDKLGICVDDNLNWYDLGNRNDYEMRINRLERFKQVQRDLAVTINNRVGGLR